MRKGWFFSALLCVLCVSAVESFAQPTPERQQQLATMIAQDCGSCHGMTRKGGLGSPLLPEVLQGYSHEAIVETILDGRPGTPMPPWKTMLSREDAEWIARALVKGPK